MLSSWTTGCKIIFKCIFGCWWGLVASYLLSDFEERAQNIYQIDVTVLCNCLDRSLKVERIIHIFCIFILFSFIICIQIMCNMSLFRAIIQNLPIHPKTPKFQKLLPPSWFSATNKSNYWDIFFSSVCQ